MEGTIKLKVNFIFNHMTISDFTQLFLNRLVSLQ